MISKIHQSLGLLLVTAALQACHPEPNYRYEEKNQRVNSLESSADILVYDLLRGKEPIALTKMPKGYYAQFPHYRSDGWLYFTVLNAWKDERFVVATDVSLHVEKSPIP